MRATSFLGPDRPEQEYPLTDAAEVRECRRILDQLTVEEIESYGASSAEELGALRDRELWGDAPFDED